MLSRVSHLNRVVAKQAFRPLAASSSSLFHSSTSMNKAVAGDAQVKSSNSNTAVNVMHKSSAALAVLVPGSLAAAGTAAAIPVDVTMSLFLTGHTVFGLQGIVEDYVPKAMQGGVNVLAAVAGGAAFAGLVGLSVYGNGVGGTMVQLWSEKAEKKSE